MSQYHYDIAIVGAGLSGGLLALAIGQARHDKSIGIFDGKSIIGGEKAEIVLANQIEGLALPVNEAVVAEWPFYFVNIPNCEPRISRQAMLLDLRLLDPLVRNFADFHFVENKALLQSGQNKTVTTPSGTWTADVVIEADDTHLLASLGLERSSRILDIGEQGILSQPVLIDTEAAKDSHEILQIFPLTGSHIVVDRLRQLPSSRSESVFCQPENAPFINPVSIVAIVARLARRIASLPEINSAAVSAATSQELRIARQEIDCFFQAIEARSAHYNIARKG
ncbi:MAG: hypothetical protein ACK5NN_01060 [Sphingomonadaceae bacterium]